MESNSITPMMYAYMPSLQILQARQYGKWKNMARYGNHVNMESCENGMKHDVPRVADDVCCL